MTVSLPGVPGFLLIAVLHLCRHIAVERGWGESQASEQMTYLQESTVAHMWSCMQNHSSLTIPVSITIALAGLMKGACSARTPSL